MSESSFDEWADASSDDGDLYFSFDEEPEDEEEDWHVDAGSSSAAAVLRSMAAAAAARQSFVEVASETEDSFVEVASSSESELGFDEDEGSCEAEALEAWSPAGVLPAIVPGLRLEGPRSPPFGSVAEAECSCPISHMLMFDPVLAADGVVYEREAIETWIAMALR